MDKRKQYRNELIATADKMPHRPEGTQFILADIAASLKVLADASAPVTLRARYGRTEVGWITEDGEKHAIGESAFRDGNK